MSLSRSAPVLKVIVLRDYCELCGLSQHFSNTFHVSLTKSEEFKGAREVLGGAHGGCTISGQKPSVSLAISIHYVKSALQWVLSDFFFGSRERSIFVSPCVVLLCG